MSLTPAQLARTAAELTDNMALIGLTEADAAADLEFTAQRLHMTLNCHPECDPVDVWQLRDYLQKAVQDAGHTPVRFTVLTPGTRLLASTWYPLRTAPRHNITTPS